MQSIAMMMTSPRTVAGFSTKRAATPRERRSLTKVAESPILSSRTTEPVGMESKVISFPQCDPAVEVGVNNIDNQVDQEEQDTRE